MKKSWIIGSVVTGHVAAISLVLMQGCQTVQSGRRTATATGLRGQPAAAPAPVQTAPRPVTVSPDGRPIRPIGEVGRPGTFTEVVVPRTPEPRPSRPLTYVQPAPSSALRPATPPKLPAAGSTYTVAKGDTLGHIAQKHGVTTRDLIRLNNINEPNKLIVGQKLSIPAGSRPTSAPASPSVRAPAGAATHKVAGGESVSVIAQKYGVKTADVLAANNLNRDSVIRVGQTLVIPGAKASTAGSPAPAPATRVDPPKTATPAGTDVSAPPRVTPTTTPPVPAPLGVQPIPLPRPPAPPAVAPASPTGTADPAFKSYTVRENEDVYSVAIKWGIAPTELRQLNNLTSSELTPGQVLRIPE